MIEHLPVIEAAGPVHRVPLLLHAVLAVGSGQHVVIAHRHEASERAGVPGNIRRHP